MSLTISEFSFDYADNNRLSTVSTQDGVVASYTYNATGERIKKTLGNQTYYYHYNLDGLLPWEFNTQNASYTHYVYLRDTILARLVITKTNK
ncbi:hypothetical protein [Abyssogena phaseoliformis symbiont]|uniref:hypothetical protein n=1 Tax=Abyssogena phaseoliformis symbiont TaxID=596095 RepID=UPI0019158185|nr:hypothetical protein [Abyssogena phaseoliformis symbiont]